MSTGILSDNQLSDAARRAKLIIAFNILTKNKPVSVAFVLRIVKSVRQRNINIRQAKTSLMAHFGRVQYAKAFRVASEAQSIRMMKTRQYADDTDKKTCVCHACLSYKAQVKCTKCGCTRFCAGCADYGDCMACVNSRA